MATYVPNATQTTEPTSSQTVESAALEFRTLKTSINSRIDALQVEVDAEEVTRASADSALDVRTTALEQLAFNGSTPGTVTVTKFVATASQTVFTLPVTPVTVATVDVYINGIYQNHDSFTLAANVVTLNEGVIAGAEVEIQASIALQLGVTSADLIEYLPSGTGAVPTDVQTKLRESVSVKDFGAVGDGVTDDTAAIQNALRQSVGKTLLFPDGTYKVTGDSILAGNVTKRGIQIPSNSDLVFSTGAVIQLTTTTETTYNVLCIYNASDIRITGGKLIGDTDTHAAGTPGSTFNGIGLRIQGATNVYVKDLSATKMYADGFAIVYDDVNSPYPECVNIVLENCTSTYNYRNGLSVIGCEDGAVIGGNYAYNGQAVNAYIGTGIDIEPNSSSGSLPAPSYVKKYAVNGASIHNNRTTGLQVYGAGASPNHGIAQDIALQGNRLWSNATNIGVYQAIGVLISGNLMQINTAASGVSINSSKKVVVDGNLIRNAGTHGILVLADTPVLSEDITVSDNIIDDATLYGIIVSGTNTPFNDVNITGNNVSGSGYGGIYVIGGTRGSIVGNSVRTSSQVVDNTYDNIQIDDTNYMLISRNTVTHGGGAAQAKYGINVVASSAHNIVENNIVYLGGKTKDLNNTGTYTRFNENKISTTFTVSNTFVTVYKYASATGTAQSVRVSVFGTDGTNSFQDELLFGSATSATVVTLSSSTIKGAPDARNYSTGTADTLRMYMSNPGNYTVTVICSER